MEKLLEVKELETGYGWKQVLFGLSLEVREGEIVALIGPNGAGKSTVLKAICGLIPTWTGEIHYRGEPVNGATPARNVARGITYAPQGSRVFHDLTVMENLEIGAIQLARKTAREHIERLLESFPILKERTRQDAGRLSGGEQQILALARALVTRPRLLMLDEPSLGLSPNLAGNMFETLVQIKRDEGVSILVVEQKVRDILEVCSRVYSMKLGKVVFVGYASDLKENKYKLRELFL